MAVITGNTGNVAVTGNFSTIIINVTEWTGSIENEFFDSRIFDGTGTHGVQEYRGSYQMTGTITGFLDDSAALALTAFNIAATVSVLTLTASTGRTYTLDAHLHNFTPSVNRRSGLNTYTCSFRSDSAVAFA